VASTARSTLGRRLGVLVAGGALVVTALTTATAGAALPPANGGAATANAPQPRRPATTSAGFVYHQGRFGRGVYTPLREVPGAAITAHLGINNHAQITGTFIDAADVPNPDGAFDTGHGFVQDRRGHTTSFDAPGASVTLPNGINDHGQITGAYVAADGAASVHGFIRDRRGTITTFEVPFWRLHNVSDINNRGQIVGYYDEPDFAGGGGFLRERDGTIITTITYPGAPYTEVHGINDRGQLVGTYLEPGAAPNPDGTIPAGTVHGFLWERGRFASFDVPGSIFTQAFGINNRGQITGGYYDATGTQHAFLQDQGRYQTLDAPGGNIAYGINDRGEIILPDPRAARLLPVAI
jgi:probable HAF family extracellular repeat protein